MTLPNGWTPVTVKEYAEAMDRLRKEYVDARFEAVSEAVATALATVNKSTDTPYKVIAALASIAAIGLGVVAYLK